MPKMKLYAPSTPSTPPLTPDDEDVDEYKPGAVNREADTLPNVETWPHRPFFICANSSNSPHLHVPKYGTEACPLGVPFEFSSELFEGSFLARIGNSNSDDPQGDIEHFTGRKRTWQTVIQGRFKEPIRVSDVMWGQEFDRPIKNPPPAFIIKFAEALAPKILPGVSFCHSSNTPYLRAPLAGIYKTIRADLPGTEPDITDHDLQEDCTLFGGAFANRKKPLSKLRRALIFSNPNKAKDYVFDTETVYTFEYYEHMFELLSYSLDLGITKIPAAKGLDGQALQCKVRLPDGRYAWSFQLWHEDLLQYSPKKNTSALPRSLALDDLSLNGDESDDENLIINPIASGSWRAKKSKKKRFNSTSCGNSTHGTESTVSCHDSSSDDDNELIASPPEYTVACAGCLDCMSCLTTPNKTKKGLVRLDSGWVGKLTALR